MYPITFFLGGSFMGSKVEKLKINFKTLEEFKKFKQYGIQELSMLEDLEANMVEDHSDSPFYGIYFGLISFYLFKTFNRQIWIYFSQCFYKSQKHISVNHY